MPALEIITSPAMEVSDELSAIHGLRSDPSQDLSHSSPGRRRHPGKEAYSCLSAGEEITRQQSMTDDEYRDWKKSL